MLKNNATLLELPHVISQRTFGWMHTLLLAPHVCLRLTSSFLSSELIVMRLLVDYN
jgi:hypothetical protein